MKSNYYVGKDIIKEEVGYWYFDKLAKSFIDGVLRKSMNVVRLTMDTDGGKYCFVGKAFLLDAKHKPTHPWYADVLVILKKSLMK